MGPDILSIDLLKDLKFAPSGITSKVLVKTEQYHYTLMCLAAGTEIDTHTSAKDAGLTVLKGEGVLTLNGKEIPLAAGRFVFFPAHAPHALRADSDLAFLLCLCAGSGQEKV